MSNLAHLGFHSGLLQSQFFKLKLYRVLNIHGYNLNKQFFLQENVVTLLFYQNRKVNSITTDCHPINTDTSLFQAQPPHTLPGNSTQGLAQG